MRALILAACLMLAVPGRAVLNSPDAWVFGTLPYETFPWHECNLEYGAAAAGEPLGYRHRLDLRYGFLDHLEGELAGETGPNFLQAGLRWRLGEQGQYRFDHGFYYRLDCLPDDPQPFGKYPGGALGLVVFRSWEETSLSLNLESGFGPGTWRVRGGWQTPFVFEGFRAGAEARVDQEAGTAVIHAAPQLGYDIPGDLKLKGGVEFGPAGAWTAVLKLSYLISPNP